MIPLEDPSYGLAFLGILALIGFCLVYGTLWALQRFAGWGGEWGSALLTFWRILGMWLVLAAGLPGVILMALGLLARRPMQSRPENPGADDNGSGVAVVLALASELKSSLPIGWDAVAAFWGAEEVGLYGSYRFVEKYKDFLDRQRTIIINVDGVGRGNYLIVGSGQGVFRRRATDAALLSQWERACEQAGASSIREWITPLTGSSDHAVWLDEKFYRALTIGHSELMPISLPIQFFNRLLAVPVGRFQRNLLHIHTPDDALENIRPDSLEETVRVIRALFSQLPAQSSFDEITKKEDG